MTTGTRLIVLLSLIFAFSTMSGCGTARINAIQKQHEALAADTGWLCHYLQQKDDALEVEIALHTELASECSPERPFSITHYSPASDVRGIMYCCSRDPKKPRPRQESTEPKSDGSATSAPAENSSAAPATTPNSTSAAPSSGSAAGAHEGDNSSKSSSAAPKKE